MLTKAMLAKIKRIRELAEENINEDDESCDFLCDICNLASSLIHDAEKLDRGLAGIKSVIESKPQPVCGFEEKEFHPMTKFKDMRPFDGLPLSVYVGYYSCLHILISALSEINDPRARQALRDWDAARDVASAKVGEEEFQCT